LDPFRYGWRPKYVRLPNGEFDEEQIPLTLEDLLDPQLGDVVPQCQPHFELLITLVELLRRHYDSREDVYVAGDMKMLWGIPGVPEPSPDLAVIFGVHKKHDSGRDSFDCESEGTRPSLIIELVSSVDFGTRNIDYEKKVEVYQRVGIPEYFIFDPPSEVTNERLMLTGYRLDATGRYQDVDPDSQGRLFSVTTGLLFGVAEDGSSPLVIDTTMAKPIPTSSQLYEDWRAAEAKALRESKAREAAEENALRESEARKAAEAEIARLRAELDRKNRS
jgi:Uma2 family endonuclease